MDVQEVLTNFIILQWVKTSWTHTVHVHIKLRLLGLDAVPSPNKILVGPEVLAYSMLHQFTMVNDMKNLLNLSRGNL